MVVSLSPLSSSSSSEVVVGDCCAPFAKLRELVSSITITMGNSSSSTSQALTQQEEDLTYLGDRFPFGDAELLHLYQAYHTIIMDQNNNDEVDASPPQGESSKKNISFLTDWAVESTLCLERQEREIQQRQAQVRQQQQHKPHKKRGVQEQEIRTNLSSMSNDDFERHLQALKQERMEMMHVVEQQILPPDLGNRLYHASCLAPGDTTSSLYYPVGGGNSSSTPTTSANASAVVDEYTRKARLTQIFQGFSDMGRRGSKAHLKVMFQACQSQQLPKKSSSTSSTSCGHAEFGGTTAAAATTTTTTSTTTVSALEMVDMGYRIALAAEYLLQRHESIQQNKSGEGNDSEEKGESDDDENENNKSSTPITAVDVTSLLPPLPGYNKDDIFNSSLRALAQSIVEKEKRRRKRERTGGGGGGSMFYPPTSYGGGSSSDDNNNNNINSDADKNNGISNDNSNDDVYAVELEDIVEWSEEVAPLFASALPTLMFRILFPGKPYPPSRTPFSYPRILQASSFFVAPCTAAADTAANPDAAGSGGGGCHANSSPLLFGLACFSSSLDGLYYRLYTSSSDGLSFNRLQNALLGYGGPTCILIRAVADDDDDNENNHHLEGGGGGVFGAFSASPWKESKDFYGTSDCFLFQLSPLTAVYRPTSVARSVDNKNTNQRTNNSGNSKSSSSNNKSNNSGPNYMYCNSYARSKGYDGQAHGIGWGGTVDQPRLFLDESLENCYAGSQDWTFENGALLPPSNNRRKQYFQVDSIEVWGVGGTACVEKALDARKLARDVKQEGIRRARKVDKAQFLDDFRSGAIDSKAFAHRQQIDGRADQDVKERHSKAYEYEK